MSLGKLLASGRSLAGGPSVGRYNVSSHNRLPKFGSAKNPFAQTAAKPAAEQQAAVANPAAVDAPAPAAPSAGSPFSPAQLKQTQRIPELAGLTRTRALKQNVIGWLKDGRAMAMAIVGKTVVLAKNLLGRVKPVRRQEPSPVFPRFGKPAVQGELSLENVRVVRNDLEESDLEIVTVQTDTSTQVAPTVASATPHRGPVPPALKKLTSRMLGVKLS